MSVAAVDATHRLRRDWASGLSSLLRFMRGRGSLEDAFEGMLALAGPTIEREFHVVAGYGRDVIGEVGVDAFTAGQMPMVPLRIFLAYLLVLKPSQPLAWTRFVREAYRRGKRTPSLACVDYEALFPLPLTEARRRIGVPSLGGSHPRGFPERGRWLARIERNIEGGARGAAHA